MKKFVLLLLALVGLPASLMLLSMPGCSNPCADLRALCNSDCADTNYEDACRSVADGNNESLCSGQLAGFRSNCSVIPNVGGAPATPESCDNGQVLCSGPSGALCVSLNSNPKYCGACNNDCTKNVAGEGGSAAEAKTKCAAGACVAKCPAALADECPADSGACVDTETDPNNCGECADTCPDGHVCVCETDAPLCSAGDCVASCAEGEAECDGSCTDLATDPLNCGACSNVCGAGQLCSNGGCASSCAEGLTECCGTCADITSDPDHCGGCVCGDSGSAGAGGAAPAGEACAENCSDGVCVGTCPDPDGNPGCCDENAAYDPTKTICGGACVDPDNNVQHCGDCFNLCAEGEKCSSGNCVSGCGETETECGSICAKLDTDPKNCGVCGNGCSASQVCSQGVCKTACDSGLTNCGGSCVDLSSDPSHCGACLDAACTGEKPKCSKGSCEAQCDPGLSDCSNHCINLTEDNFFHCGSCNNSCGDESVCTVDSCSNSECTNLSGALTCNGGNICKKSDCDPKLGCADVLYSAAEVEGICTQVQKVSYDSATQCLYCDSDKFCTTIGISADADSYSCSVNDCAVSKQAAPTAKKDHSLCPKKPNDSTQCLECLADDAAPEGTMTAGTGCSTTIYVNCN